MPTDNIRKLCANADIISPNIYEAMLLVDGEFCENYDEKDIDRIIEMHMSPINIYIHTTNPELRNKMLNNRFAGDSLKYLKKLADANIKINGQIVLCKGINDKENR